MHNGRGLCSWSLDFLLECLRCIRTELLSCLPGKPQALHLPPPNSNRLQIGRTSGLVLTLCGVLKDILLVGFSIIVWGTPISGLQTFGYSIAIVGMLYYKLGQKELKPYIAEASRRWSEFGANRPALRKLLIVGIFITAIILLLSSLAPTYAPGYDPAIYLKNPLGRS
jgi:hypothetical protein